VSNTTRSINGYDIVTRWDGSFAVHDFCWWPDEELDSDPLFNEEYLYLTGGYRKKGWVLTFVASSFDEARAYATGTPFVHPFNV
jgi:hypothetical protein